MDTPILKSETSTYTPIPNICKKFRDMILHGNVQINNRYWEYSLIDEVRP